MIYKDKLDDTDDIPHLDIINNSSLHVELLCNQYFDTVRFDTSLLNIQNRIYFVIDNNVKFYFEKESWRYLELKEYVIMKVNGNKFELEKCIQVHRDSIPRNSLAPFLESSHSENKSKKYKSWEIDIRNVAEGCLDTQYYTTIIKTTNGNLIFQNHNNTRLYLNEAKDELYLISIRWCRNEFLLYKIYEL